MFNQQPQTSSPTSSPQHVPKQLDHSKTEFLNRQSSQTESATPEHVRRLDQTKIAAFAEQQQRLESVASPAKSPKQLDQTKTAVFTQQNTEEGGRNSAPSSQVTN